MTNSQQDIDVDAATTVSRPIADLVVNLRALADKLERGEIVVLVVGSAELVAGRSDGSSNITSIAFPDASLALSLLHSMAQRLALIEPAQVHKLQ